MGSSGYRSTAVRLETSNEKVKRLLLTIFQYFWLSAAAFMILLPLVWMVVASLTEGKLLSAVPLIPDFSKFSLEHYIFLFTEKSDLNASFSNFVEAFLRTMGLAALNTLVTVLFTTLSAYVFARFQFKGKRPILIVLLLLQMFPTFMGMIAIFMIFRMLGWLNQPLLFVTFYLAGVVPFNIYLIRGYMRNIPRSLDEAARIDGAGNMMIFWKIIIPLSKPILGFVAISAFMAPWMDYMLPLQLLNRQSETVAILLYRMTDPLQPLWYNPLNFMAAGLLLAIPILLVNLFMQRFIMYGMTAGAEKG